MPAQRHADAVDLHGVLVATYDDRSSFGSAPFALFRTQPIFVLKVFECYVMLKYYF